MSVCLRYSLFGILCLVLLSPQASAQGILWETHNEAGNQFSQQGKYAEAEKQFLAALLEAEKFGSADRRLARSLTSLATLYRAQSKYAEAESLYRRALEIDEALFRRALKIDEKALGPDHPDIAISLTNLAFLYHAQARYAEAEALFRRALAIIEQAVGPAHPKVAATLESYAALLRKTNREYEALKTEARAKAIRAMYAQQNPTK